MKILISQGWINGILEGIRGICSGDRTSVFSKYVSLFSDRLVTGYLRPKWSKGLRGR